MIKSVPRHNKVALVDFDGVIFRNNRVHSLIKKRINSYVGKVLKSENAIAVDRVNEYLYNTYGHTLLGLERIVGKEQAGSLYQFNKFVYSDVNIDRDDYYDIRRELHDWEVFVTKCKLNNVPIYIFSNAPKDWCLNFIEEETISGFVGDNLPTDSELLKPEMRIFEMVDTWFSDKTIFFVDDKIHNMKYTVNNDKWVNIVFDTETSQNMLKVKDKFFISKNLNACGDLICF